MATINLIFSCDCDFRENDNEFGIPKTCAVVKTTNGVEIEIPCTIGNLKECKLIIKKKKIHDWIIFRRNSNANKYILVLANNTKENVFRITVGSKPVEHKSKKGAVFVVIKSGLRYIFSCRENE
jgi:hypothetical protein